MIYIAIFSMLAIVFSSILVTFTKVNVSQVGQNEVASQLNFVIQTIQREISNSSLVVVRSDDPADIINPQTGSWDEQDQGTICTNCKYLVLYPRDIGNGATDNKGPILIYKGDGPDPDTDPNEIIIRRGRGTGATGQTTEVLNAGIVIANSLTFNKFSNKPGRDLVEINMALTANNAGQTITRSLRLSVAKAVAATFDTPVIPGTTNAFDLGSGGNKWKDGYINGNLRVDTLTKTNQLAIGLDASGNPLGSTLTGVFTGNVTVNPPSIANGAHNTGTYFLSGLPASLVLSANDRLFITTPSNMHAASEDFAGVGCDLIYIGATPTVGTNNSVSITLFNVGTGSCNYNPTAAGQWKYLLVR